jgi:hypothetical protein
MKPVVSVSMITYNHEKWVGEAIESVLSQQCSVPFELVIGDDCSTDRTCSIIRAFGRERPDVIRVLPSERNIGAGANCRRTLEACRGEFIAWLDGDDCWCCNLKLEMQLELLRSDTSLSMCYGLAAITNLDGTETIIGQAPAGHGDGRAMGLRELCESNRFASCTVMYRASAVRQLPPWFGRRPLCDWPLHLLACRCGNAGYLEKVLARYRVHSGGVWSSRSAAAQSRLVSDVLSDAASELPMTSRMRLMSLAGLHAGIALAESECVDLWTRWLLWRRYLLGCGWIRRGVRKTLAKRLVGLP